MCKPRCWDLCGFLSSPNVGEIFLNAGWVQCQTVDQFRFIWSWNLLELLPHSLTVVVLKPIISRFPFATLLCLFVYPIYFFLQRRISDFFVCNSSSRRERNIPFVISGSFAFFVSYSHLRQRQMCKHRTSIALVEDQKLSAKI